MIRFSLPTLSVRIKSGGALALAFFLTACQPAAAPSPTGSTGSGATARLSGAIAIDGSSTVFPVTEAVAEEFRKVQPGVRTTVGISGTGGGFQKFCNGELDIADASRPISTSEQEACRSKSIEWVELPVAIDGLSVVVHPQNTWANCMTVAELKQLWEPEATGTVMRWNQIRPDWPDQPVRLYGPGTDSGTFDYFTEVINGRARASRSDFTASEDDNVLVQGVSGDQNALGYFGYAYYQENRNRLKLVQVDGGSGCVTPSDETILGGTYKPLSRPIYIYPSRAALQRPEVLEFTRFYLSKGPELVPQVGYIKQQPAVYAEGLRKLESASAAAAY
jgi:phosphate transport system substrate-binding protein